MPKKNIIWPKTPNIAFLAFFANKQKKKVSNYISALNKVVNHVHTIFPMKSAKVGVSTGALQVIIFNIKDGVCVRKTDAYVCIKRHSDVCLGGS